MQNTYAIHLDFETYSEADVKKVGSWNYSVHESTLVLCACVAVVAENKPPRFMTFIEEDTLADSFKHLIINATEIRCWNIAFEYGILVNVLKISPEFLIGKMCDTMHLALQLALPKALGQCAQVIGKKDAQKDKRGAELIRKLSVPQKTKTGRVRNADPQLLVEMYDYCKQDVVTEMTLHNLFTTVINKTYAKEGVDFENRVKRLDFDVNCQGIPVDLDLCRGAIAISHALKNQLEIEITELTEGEITNIRQIKKIKNYAKERGVDLETLDANAVKDLLSNNIIDDVIRKILETRQELGRSSIAKFEAFIDKTEKTTSRSRFNFIYHGTTTGRWTSTGVNFQNMSRGIGYVNEIRDMINNKSSVDDFDLVFGSTTKALQSAIRGAIHKKDKILIQGDFGQIEARVLAYLAGQKDILDVFKSGKDLYIHAAAGIYNVKPEKITDEQRFIGKVATLALGYQGSVNAFLTMSKNYGVEVSADKAETIVKAWRLANKKIVKFWYDAEKAFKKAVLTNKETVLETETSKFLFKYTNGFLFIRLPSGRCLAFANPKIEEDRIIFWRTDPTTKQWAKKDTYSGKIVENITQAVARDIMACKMLDIQNKLFMTPIMHTHDELVYIAEQNQAEELKNKIEKIAVKSEGWYSEIPLKFDTKLMARYSK